MSPAGAETKTCPWCGEEIKAAAILCRYCRGDVTPQGVTEAQQFAAKRSSSHPSAAEAPSARVPSFQDPVLSRLSKYLPESLLQGILESAELIDEGERRPIAVLFADVSGYTALTEKIGAEAMADLLKAIYARVEEIISRYGGVVDKFIGDAVMALFGAYRAQGDDPERAIRAALDIRSAVRAFGESRGYELDTHSGIAYGEVVLDIREGRGRLDYQTIGDAVNLASRLQGLAPTGELWTDHRIYTQTRTTFRWEDLPPVEIKGVSRPVRVHRVSGVRKLFAKVVLGERIEMVPLVGREADLARLEKAAARAAQGAGEVAIVRGPPGIGKSRLTYEFYHKLPKGRFHWYTARCLSFGANIPFLPFTKLLQSIFQIYEDSPAPLMEGELRAAVDLIYAPAMGRARREDRRKAIAERSELAAAAAALFLSVADKTNPLLGLTPQERRTRLFEGLTDLLIQLCSEKPTVLVFEDVHWADADSLEFLDHLILALRAKSVLLLILTRPDLAHRFPGQDDFTGISLGELTGKESELLLSRLLRVGRLPKTVRDKIVEKAEGNPFYMEEVILSLRERGILERRGDHYHVVGTIQDVEIPDTVEGIVLARLDRLERSLKRVIQCAAVIGQEFRYRTLAHVTEASERLRDHLINLLTGEYVLQQSLIPELVYIFRHTVMRDVAYGTLLEKRRRAFHARIGEAMEGLFADRIDEFVEILAYHFERGRVAEKALLYLEKAAIKCEALYANRAAADHWERLLAFLKAEPSSGHRPLGLRAMLHCAELYRLLGRVSEAITISEASCKEAQELGDNRQLATAFRLRGEALRLAGRVEEAAEFLNEAARAAQTAGDKELIAACLNTSGNLARMRGQFPAARKAFEEVLRIATELSDRRRRYQALNHLAILSMSDGELAQAEANFKEALALTQELGIRDEQVQIELNLGILYLRLGRSDEACKMLTSALAIAESIESERGAQLCLLALGDLYVKTGEFVRARATLGRLLGRAKDHPFDDISAVALTNEARALVSQDKLPQANQAVVTASTLAEASDNYIGRIDARAVQAEIASKQGRPAEALKSAQAMLALVEERGEREYLSYALALCARAFLASGEKESALVAARKALDGAREERIPRDEAWALWVLGRCQGAFGQLESSRETIRAALELANLVHDSGLAREILDYKDIADTDG